MGKIISVANQKGGVGKTTSAVNLSACLGYNDKKVLIVDIDPQGNASSGLGIVKKDILSTYNLIIDDTDPMSVIQNTEFKNLDIMPCSIELAGAEIELVELKDRVHRLKKSLGSIKSKYDFVIIDCPPSLGLITLNALVCCDSVLIPMQCEYYALEGISQLINTIRTVKRMYNSLIDIEGVLLTMYDTRLNLTMQVVDEIKKYFPQKVYKTAIPRNVRLSESPSHGKPVIYYDKSSKGSKAYNEFSKELIDKNK